MNGIININKPMGITSHDVVYKVRKKLGIKKVGHTGTLDPNATGVLPICVGKGTKASDFIMGSDKEYIAKILFGMITDTQDIWGNLISKSQVLVKESEFISVINGFVGVINQIPPMYSAIKINGKKLCDMARKGIEVERKSRVVTVYSIEVLEFCGDSAKIRVACSKGTYIRTLIADIGEKLGCGAVMSGLVRTKSGNFNIEYSVNIEDICENNIMPIDEYFCQYQKVHLDEMETKKVKNGIQIEKSNLEENKMYRLYGDGEFLTISRMQDGKLKMVICFYG